MIGELAHVRVLRKDTPGVTADSLLEITNQKTTVVWPDLVDEKSKNCFGGSQYDPRGMDKMSYEEKYKHQEFKLEIVCASDHKESDDTIPITAYDPAPADENKIGLVVSSDYPAEQVRTLDLGKGIFITHNILYNPKFKKHVDTLVEKVNAGHFWIEFKEGEVVITVKLDLDVQAEKKPVDKVTVDYVFEYIKKSVESYWNDPARGLGQWVFHRENCLRGDKCNCSVPVKKGTSFIYRKAHGCCKVSVRLVLEQGPDNKVNIWPLTPYQEKLLKQLKKISPKDEWALPDIRANTLNLYYPENRFGTYAHEIGHMLGLPDQYKGGAVSLEPGKFPVDTKSVMGSREGGGNVPKGYVENYGPIYNWINVNIDKMRPIKS
jgi:hypothetical protein